MVALYKLKREREMMSKDESRSLHLEGSERNRGKLEVRQGLKDNEDSNDLLLRMEEQWDADMRLDEECWRRQQADPDNYVCRCFEKKEE